MTVPKINSAHGSDTRNVINRAIEVLNRLGIDVQALVAEGQLTEEQYARLLTTINGLVSRGDLSVHDIDINKGKLMPRHLSEEVLRMMTGDTPVNAVPALKSITRDKLADKLIAPQQTTFLKTDNLWDGVHHRNIFISGSADKVVNEERPSVFLHSAIINVEPGKEYTFRKEQGGDRFNIAFVESIPLINEEIDAIELHRGTQTSLPRFLTMEAPEGSAYAVLHVNSNSTILPEIIVVEGSYIPEDINSIEFNEDLKDYPKIKRSNKNLFDGKYEDYSLVHSVAGTERIFVSTSSSGTVPKTAIVQVSGGNQYSVSIPNNDNNFIRVAGFNTLPTLNAVADQMILIGGSDTGDESIYTFDVDENINYLGIYVSNENIEPIMQVEKGNPTQYEPPETIDKKYIEYLLPKTSSLIDKKDAIYNFYYNLNQLYAHKEIEDYTRITNHIPSEDFHDLMHALISGHEDKIERTTLGQDDYGNNIYQYETLVTNYFKAPFGDDWVVDNGEEIKQPKFIITSGFHGDEKAPNYSIYYFIRELLESENELFEFLLDNVKFVFLPVMNPYGFYENTRTNGSDIDLNRDFSDGVIGEKETQIMKNVFLEHLDADFYIDFHMMWQRPEIIGYTHTDQDDLRKTGLNLYRTLGKKWLNSSTHMPSADNKNVIRTLSRPNDELMVVGYAERNHDIPSILLELTRSHDSSLEGNHSEPVVRLGVEILVNMITGALRLRQ